MYIYMKPGCGPQTMSAAGLSHLATKNPDRQGNEGRAVNRQPGFRSGDTYRRICFRQEFFRFFPSPFDLCTLYCNARGHAK